MLNVFVADPRGCLVKAEAAPDRPLPDAAVWIDLPSDGPPRQEVMAQAAVLAFDKRQFDAQASVA